MSYHFVECECTHKKYFNWRVEYLNSWEHWQMQDTAAWHPAQRLANGTRQNRNEVPVFPDYLKQTHTQTKTQRAKGKSNEAPNTHDMWLSRAKRESESCSYSSSSSTPLLLFFSTSYISSTCSGKNICQRHIMSGACPVRQQDLELWQLRSMPMAAKCFVLFALYPAQLESLQKWVYKYFKYIIYY